MKWLSLLLLFAISACTQPSPKDDFSIGGLHLQPAATWRAETAKGGMAVLEFNRGMPCNPAECARLNFYTSDFPEWKSWFDEQGNYTAEGGCDKEGAQYAQPKRVSDKDIKVGGAEAQYFESSSCTLGYAHRRHTWLVYDGSEPSLLVHGIPAATFDANDGNLPYAAIVEMLTNAHRK